MNNLYSVKSNSEQEMGLPSSILGTKHVNVNYQSPAEDLLNNPNIYVFLSISLPLSYFIFYLFFVCLFPNSF